MEVYVRGTVWYSCTLSDEDTRKVIKYAKENDCEYKEAVLDLYNQAEINLYNECIESDYSTEDIEGVNTDDLKYGDEEEDE